jgi:putative FmdB family regulatory protein
MPTYDYECSACNHSFERFQSITAKPIRKCPSCGRNAARRLIGTGGGIIFRGSGFYQTDYRSESYKKAAKAATEGGSTAQAGATSTAKTGGDGATTAKAADAPKKKGDGPKAG